MNKKKIVSAKLPLYLLALLVAAVAGATAYLVWQQETEITIIEPLTVTTSTPIGSLPVTIEAYPGMFLPCDIIVENVASFNYTVTFAYTVNASEGVIYTITPDSGTNQTISARGTVTFHVTIEVAKNSAPGTLTIDWKIFRS